MAKLTQKDFMTKLQAIIGDRTDDEAISFIEDCKDTISDAEDVWQKKYEDAVKEKEELDKTWRKKYTDRFFSADSHNDNNNDNHENNHNTNPANVKKNDVDEEQEKLEQAEKIRFDDLFKPAD
jgi:hypothetical protein